MFKKWGSESEMDESGSIQNAVGKETEFADNRLKTTSKSSGVYDSGTAVTKGVNTILKGSKLTGDISVTSDIIISGDVEGNIKSEQDSSIILKGNCTGNVETKGGSVIIDGSLNGGNISAGRDVTISGKFNGGEIKAAEKIYVDGEFNGKLEGKDIEIGAHAQGRGELHYRQHISIARGANVEVQIRSTQDAIKPEKESPAKKIVDIRPGGNSPEAAKV